jgi:hypothetical protein
MANALNRVIYSNTFQLICRRYPYSWKESKVVILASSFFGTSSELHTWSVLLFFALYFTETPLYWVPRVHVRSHYGAETVIIMKSLLQCQVSSHTLASEIPLHYTTFYSKVNHTVEPLVYPCRRTYTAVSQTIFVIHGGYLHLVSSSSWTETHIIFVILEQFLWEKLCEENNIPTLKQLSWNFTHKIIIQHCLINWIHK